MVFLNVATRRVWVSPATRNPTEAWVVEQAKAFIDHTEDNDLKVEMVTRDNDQISTTLLLTSDALIAEAPKKDKNGGGASHLGIETC